MAITSIKSKVRESAEYVLYQLMNDITADESKSDEVEGLDIASATLIVVTAAGVSGGVVELEGSPTTAYGGTWKQLASITTNAASTVFAASIDAGDTAAPAFPYLRVRVSTVISGGATPSIDAYLLVKRGS